MKLLKNWYLNLEIKSNTDKRARDASTSWQASDTILIRIPTNELKLRNLYLFGINAILNNLPRPKIVSIDCHSYISLRYAMSDFLGKGKCPTKIECGNKGYIYKIVN